MTHLHLKKTFVNDYKCYVTKKHIINNSISIKNSYVSLNIVETSVCKRKKY